VGEHLGRAEVERFRRLQRSRSGASWGHPLVANASPGVRVMKMWGAAGSNQNSKIIATTGPAVGAGVLSAAIAVTVQSDLSTRAEM
jgi:hypothetical protein